MGNAVLIGQYIERDSFIHKLDPRTKLLSITAFMISILMLESAISYAVATIFVFGALLVSKIPARIVWRGIKPILFILIFTFLYHVIFTKGTVIWSWSFIELTVEGLLNGVRFVWRIVLLVLLASILTLTTKPLTLAHGLEKLLSPLSKLNIPVEQFSLMIVIAIRFIPTIMQELDRILLAQKARGFDITTLPLMKRLFSYIPILVPLLFTTIQRAEQLTFAIEARAYGRGKGRTSYNELEFMKADFLVGGITILCVLTLLLLKI